MSDKGSDFDSLMPGVLMKRCEKELHFLPCALVFPDDVHNINIVFCFVSSGWKIYCLNTPGLNLFNSLLYSHL